MKSLQVGDSNPLLAETCGDPLLSLAPDLAPDLLAAFSVAVADPAPAASLVEVLRAWPTLPGHLRDAIALLAAGGRRP